MPANDYFEEVESYEAGYDASWYDDYKGFKPAPIQKDPKITPFTDKDKLDNIKTISRTPRKNKTFFDKISNKFEDVAYFHKVNFLEPLEKKFSQFGAWGKKLYYLAFVLAIVAIFYYLNKFFKIFNFIKKGARK